MFRDPTEPKKRKTKNLLGDAAASTTSREWECSSSNPNWVHTTVPEEAPIPIGRDCLPQVRRIGARPTLCRARQSYNLLPPVREFWQEGAMDEAETEEDQGESERDEELRNDWSRSIDGIDAVIAVGMSWLDPDAGVGVRTSKNRRGWEADSIGRAAAVEGNESAVREKEAATRGEGEAHCPSLHLPPLEQSPPAGWPTAQLKREGEVFLNCIFML